jgi:caffeoyl-CoA O-methyltransferase
MFIIFMKRGNSMDASQGNEEQRLQIRKKIADLYAPEDGGLRNALKLGTEAGLPDIQISPIHGKFLQLLATTCNARKILELGALFGYSGIWLARALPLGGRLITLEFNPKHAEVTRRSFSEAGLGDRTEVRVGNALELLPQLRQEAPFDLIFIDADKINYVEYLKWALQLIREGGIIVADNCIPSGTMPRFPEPGSEETIEEYNRLVAANPDLVSLALPIDDSQLDGFCISVVRHRS